ncbi:outer membrane beta-barrel protein [Massilia sp. BHUDP2]|uniref:outer membrane protein n=1 Tax=Massilia sp. BHUDP2 TaxID=3034505 RepID=UPI001AE4CC8A
MNRLMQNCVALAAALLSAQASAQAVQARSADPVRYWGAHAGVNTLKDWDAQVDFGFGTPRSGHADLDRGVHGGLMVGRQSEHLRYELEYETGRIEVERLTLDPLSQAVNGKGRYHALFANAYRTDRLSERIDSFVGGGIGWGRVKLPQLGLGANCNCFGPASKSGFAWQLRAGLGYRVSDQASVSLQYTWLSLPRPEAEGPPGIRYDRKRFGAVTLGYSRQF